MNIQLRASIVACSLMIGAALLAKTITPTQKLSELQGTLDLESHVPTRFGKWTMVVQGNRGIVDPQRQELLDRLYTQMLARTYVNSNGDQIMLSIAYGDDQRDGMQMHYPEVCYPAQGFSIKNSSTATIQTISGSRVVRQLETSLGTNRPEPVTYWTTIGEQAVFSGTSKKLAEMQYGLRGIIPDGLLFRASSIDQNSQHAFQVHQQFIYDLTNSIDPKYRSRIIGE